MTPIIFGILGLLFISTGVILHKRLYQDISYILGGIFLVTYSVSIRDSIFIILQVVFIIVAVIDIFHKKVHK